MKTHSSIAPSVADVAQRVTDVACDTQTRLSDDQPVLIALDDT